MDGRVQEYRESTIEVKDMAEGRQPTATENGTIEVLLSAAADPEMKTIDS